MPSGCHLKEQLYLNRLAGKEIGNRKLPLSAYKLVAARQRRLQSLVLLPTTLIGAEDAKLHSFVYISAEY